MKRIGLAVASLLSAGSAAATIHDVPADFPTASAAVAAAAPGDTIDVAPGTYSPSLGESFPLAITSSNLTIRGAGMGVTVLDAEGLSRVITWSAPAGGRVTGFTIRGGVADRGGGVFINSGNPEVDGNLLIENGALLRGAGIFVLADTLSVVTPWIHHNVVWANFDTNLGDAQDPHGVNYGGQAAGVFEHNLIGRTDGNGLLTNMTTAPLVRHNIFLENGIPGPPARGRGICWLGTQPATIHHNLFHANQVAAVLWPAGGGGGNFSGVAANDVSPSDGVYGNLDGDPLLTSPDTGDFHLQPGSPAIDAGDPALPFDPDGTVADLGPFFFDQTAVDAPGVVSRRALANVYGWPNPFRDVTTLRFDVVRAGRVAVDVVDVAGRVVRRLDESDRAAGSHRIAWDGRDASGLPVSSGVYLAIVRAGGEAKSAPLVRLR